jgi:hypothetical protein
MICKEKKKKKKRGLHKHSSLLYSLPESLSGSHLLRSLPENLGGSQFGSLDSSHNSNLKMRMKRRRRMIMSTLS